MIIKYMNDEMCVSDKFFSIFENIDDKEPLTIYMTGKGGYVDNSFIFFDFINRFPQDVTIIAHDYLCSADAFVFLFTNSKKVVLPNTKCLIHKNYDFYTISKNTNFKPFFKKKLESILDDYFSGLFVDILDYEDYQKYLNGEDVWLVGDRLKEICKKAEKKLYTQKDLCNTFY